MKNLILSVVLLSVSFSIAQAQQVSNSNWTLIHERTATWCPFCGSWGWDLKTQLINKFANQNVIFMAVHHSGDLDSPTSVEFGNNFSGSGQPIFYVDGVDVQAFSNNIASTLDNTQLEVDFKNSVQTIAGVGIDAELNKTDNILNVKAKVEFFSDVEGGDYYLGLYLVEDVMNAQTARTGPQLHKNVLRSTIQTPTFGTPLKTGAITQGTTFDVNGSISGITADRDKIKVVGIIWTKVNNKYLFFNANIANAGIPASTSNFTKEESFNAYQAESGNIVVDLKNIEISNTNMITLYDISGKIVAQKSNVSGNVVNINGEFNPGIYVMTITNGVNKVSRKIVIQ